MIGRILTIFGNDYATNSSGLACNHTFFGLKQWYYYLPQSSFDKTTCDVKSFSVIGGGSGSDLILVILAIVDDLLRVAGIIAVFYVIYGAVQYILSQGSPDQTAKAQSTILNAFIGLAISIVAVGLVAFVGNHLGGS